LCFSEEPFNRDKAIQTMSRLTVLTSHKSVFGPVTTIKLEIWISGHNPVKRQYTPWVINKLVIPFLITFLLINLYASFDQ
jgi:hypothetical protein